LTPPGVSAEAACEDDQDVATAIDTFGPTGRAPRQPIVIRNDRRKVDKVFRGVARGTGIGTLALLFFIGLFLAIEGYAAVRTAGWAFFTRSGFNTIAKVTHFGVAASLYGTIVVALVALVVATPVAVATALFLTEYAPRRLRRLMIAVVDLAAAIPSVIYGLWGIREFEPSEVGISSWMSHHLAWIPLFKVTTPKVQASLFIAGLVVGIMIVPIIASVCREVFSLTPAGEKEGALALGATKASMIRRVVLPFGRGGVISAVMLGMGRALGETIAVVFILSQSFFISDHILQPGGTTIASFIAINFGSGGALGTHVLLMAGLVLFAITLAINLAASAVVSRSRSGAGVEL
jgi:phosphate transport system permease protein